MALTLGVLRQIALRFNVENALLLPCSSSFITNGVRKKQEHLILLIFRQAENGGCPPLVSCQTPFIVCLRCAWQMKQKKHQQEFVPNTNGYKRGRDKAFVHQRQLSYQRNTTRAQRLAVIEESNLGFVNIYAHRLVCAFVITIPS